MNRKEFLIIVWKKILKPLIIVGILFFCGKISYSIFSNDKIKQFILLIIIGIGLLILISHLIEKLFNLLSENLSKAIPDTIKPSLRIIGKLFSYILPILLGMIIYHFGKEDWVTSSLILGALLIEKLKEIIKEEKQNITQNESRNHRHT
ncbi:hypothetical protein [Tenacibaculum sp. 190130A14a]